MGIQKALVALMGALVALLANFGVELDPKILQVVNAALPTVTAVLVYAIRNRSGARGAASVTSVVLGVLLAGCATYEITNAEGQTLLEGRIAGRGCIAVDSHPDGGTSAVVAQDGESNWSTIFGLTFLGEIVGGVFGREGGDPPEHAVYGSQGCEGLFVAGDPEPEELEVAEPVAVPMTLDPSTLTPEERADLIDALIAEPPAK